MKFDELDERSKIQAIKNSLALIIQYLLKHPEKISEYVAPKKPVFVEPKLEPIKKDLTTKTRNEIKERNLAAIESARQTNIRLEEEYNKRVAMANKVMEKINSLRKQNTTCSCGQCFDTTVLQTSLPEELELLIDAAKLEAQKIS